MKKAKMDRGIKTTKYGKLIDSRSPAVIGERNRNLTQHLLKALREVDLPESLEKLKEETTILGGDSEKLQRELIRHIDMYKPPRTIKTVWSMVVTELMKNL
jgi:hypothetical protein